VVENALDLLSEKNSPKHGSIFGHFFKKHTRETRERKENESIQQLFLEKKEALKSLERGGSKKKEAKRENVLFCRFRSPLICGCTSVSFKNTTLN